MSIILVVGESLSQQDWQYVVSQVGLGKTICWQSKVDPSGGTQCYGTEVIYVGSTNKIQLTRPVTPIDIFVQGTLPVGFASAANRVSWNGAGSWSGTTTQQDPFGAAQNADSFFMQYWMGPWN